MAAGRIGPNALTQLLAALERTGGPALRDRMLARAGIVRLPDTSGMIAEDPVRRLHQALRADLPTLAPALAREAGTRTADYLLAHRIPALAQRLLRVLPRGASGRLLSRAIAKNAWTFAGSGRFGVLSGWPAEFTLHDNPVVRGEKAHGPVCDWHVAVFERLFRALVDDRARVTEVACCAAGASACRFVVTRGGKVPGAPLHRAEAMDQSAELIQF